MFTQALFLVISLMAIVAGFDHFLGNRFGLGKEFEEGFASMGPLAMVMVGVTCLSPYLQHLIEVSLGRLFVAMGADPSVACSIMLSCDSGCYPLAKQLARDPVTAEFVTFTLAATLAPTIGFVMPVGIVSVDPKDTDVFSVGCMAGLAAIPIGAAAGGILLGMPPGGIFINLLPIVIFDVVLILLLKFFTKQTIFGFALFSRGFSLMVRCGLVLAIFQELTGIILLKDMLPSAETMVVVGNIAFVLAGAYPLLLIIRKLLGSRMDRIGMAMGINAFAVVGMIASLANCFPMMTSLKKMNRRGVMQNIAFAIGAGWVFGDHLGYTAAASPGSLVPMIAGKLVCAAVAMILGNVFFRMLGMED